MVRRYMYYTEWSVQEHKMVTNQLKEALNWVTIKTIQRNKKKSTLTYIYILQPGVGAKLRTEVAHHWLTGSGFK